MRLSRLSMSFIASAALVVGGLVSVSPAQAATTGEIDGLVLSSNQIGQSGVTVTLEEPITGVSTGLSTTTDALGNWAITAAPIGEYVVHYTGPFDGYANDLATLDAATPYSVYDGFSNFVYDVLTSVTVPPNYQVSVRGSDGAQLDLCPRFYPAANPDDGPYGDSCTTTGGVTSGIIAPGSYLVEFLDYSGAYAGTWIGGDGTKATATPVTIGASLTDLGTVTMPVAAHITVRLRTNDTRGPVPGLTCVVAFVGRTQTFGNNGCADEAGLVTIDGLRAGRYSLQTNVQSLDYVDRWSGDSRTQSGATLVAVKSGQTVVAPTITVPRGGVITGTVRDKKTGAPVQGICASTGRFSPVGQEDGTRQLLDSCSDADGHYRIRGLDSVPVRIQFVSAGYNPSPASYAIAWYGGSNHDDAKAVEVPLGKSRKDIDVSLVPEGRLVGNVVDAAGGPIPGFISADDFRTGYPISYGEDYPGTEFTIGHLPTGTILLRWDTPSGQRYWDGTPYGTANRSKAVSIRTRAGQTLTGISVRVA